ncbi:MAG: FAD-dependent oxidoreductase [Candidatus Obscuribacterales bacterium]|nr:FAD-dependent oxidoreductase [Candidatus Obscuribacterales bacterium]
MANRKELSRRKLLQLGGAGVILSSLLAKNNAVAGRVKSAGKANGKIVVIGAGISGLGAARVLKDSGFEVTVIEARQRIGGRIFTDRTSLGVPIELGASWIHGISGNPLYKLALKGGIQAIDCEYDSMPQIFNNDGKELSPDAILQLKCVFSKLKKRLMHLQGALGDKDKSVAESISEIVPDLNLSPSDAVLLKHVIATDIENDYAANADRLSLRFFDEDESFTGGDYLVPPGYSRTVEYLARDLDIRMNAVVLSVDYSDSKVAIDTERAGKFTADYVLVTLPLGVLKKKTVQFTPDLPTAKQKAINELGMGIFDKVYLRLSESFWSSKYTWIEFADEQPDRWPMFFNILKFTGEPILVAFNVGHFALQLENKESPEIIADCMSVLRTMYGAKIPDPIAAKCTSWGKDPFAFGSYSYIPVNASSALYDDLGAPVNNRLFFAGEACSSKHFSSADAAYMSGLNAAKQILQSAQFSKFKE